MGREPVSVGDFFYALGEFILFVTGIGILIGALFVLIGGILIPWMQP